MKISELIEILKGGLTRYGDIEVQIVNLYSYGDGRPEKDKINIHYIQQHMIDGHNNKGELINPRLVDLFCIDVEEEKEGD